MGKENKNPEQGFLDEESQRFLLGEEVGDSQNDNFEGSKEEHQIFTDVFYGKNACSTSKSCAGVGMINYGSDRNSQSRAVGSLNSESAVTMSQPSLKDLCGGVHMERFKEINVDASGSGHLRENLCDQLEFDVHCNLNSKKLMLSSEGLFALQRKERGYCLSDNGNKFVLLNSPKHDSRTNMLDLNHMSHPTPYRIVESFSQGIISSCYFLGHYDESDGPNSIDDNSPSGSSGGNDLTEDLKQDDEGKTIMTLVSRESPATKLLIVDEHNTSTTSKESKFFDSDVAESSMVFVRELPNRLRIHARNLLLDAGWKIEARRRKDRSKLYSIFKTPVEGLVIYSLIKAWRLCGEWLVAGGINSSQGENNRQWLHINEFWHDLADALAYIEKEIHHPQGTMSRLQKWHLLDPFVSVVCIDKKIGALKEGKIVKFVKGRSVELHLNKKLSFTGKSGLSFENHHAKFTSYSLSRSSQCLPPCGPSNICTSAPSSLNHAIVDESILMAVKPEVIQTSCNERLDCKSCHEFHMQVHHDSKEKHGYRRLHRKLSFGEDRKRSLKSPARRMGNGSNCDKSLQNVKHMVSVDCLKQKSTALGVPSLTRKSSTLSDITSEPNIHLSPGSQISPPNLTKQGLKVIGAASTNKSSNHKLKKGISASDLGRNFSIENQPYEEAASSQPTSNLYLKGDIASHRRNKKCSQRVSAYGKMNDASSALKEAEQLVGRGSSLFHGSSNGVVLCLASDGKITANSHSGFKEKNNVLGEGLNEKVLRHTAALGNKASLSLKNQMSDHLAEGQKVQFFYTWQAVSGKQIDVGSQVAMCQDTHPSVYQPGSVSGVLFGADGSDTQSLDFAAQQTLCREDSLVNPKCLKEKPADAIEASKSGQEHTSAAVPVNKMASKRSRKISDIAAIRLQHQNMKTTPPSEKFEGEIGLDLDDKMNDNLDLPLCQGVDNTLEVDTVSWTLMTSENHEVPHGSAIKMSGIPGFSSGVTEICTAEEKHKKQEMLRTRSVKINPKCRKRKQQEVKSGSCSLNMDKDRDGGGECHNDDNKCEEKNVMFLKSTSKSSLKHTKTKNFPTLGGKSKMPIVLACNNKSLVRAQNNDGTMEACLLSEWKSPESQTNTKTAKRNNSEAQKENCGKRRRGDDIDDDDLLIAVIIKTKDPCSNSTHSSCIAKRPQSKGCRNLKGRKGTCKLLLRTPGKVGTHSISGARSPLAWLIYCGVISLNAAVQYRTPKNNTISKDGRVTREGIKCKCCSKILSVSAFKCHAGNKLNQSSLNLFLESGKSYTLCQLQAWSDEYKARKDGRHVAEVEEVDQNDDTCGLCGDGGDLICCDNCPSTFHQSCLHSQVIPEGSWYCPNCTCKICGDAVVAKMPLGSFIMLECSQCEQKYHDMCLKKKDSSHDRLVSGTWFCGGCCERVYFGLRSRVGVMNSMADGFSWTILRCNHSDQKVQSAQKVAMMAECNSKLAVALTIMEECFLPMIDPRTGINLIPQVLYNWGSNFPRLNYHGFYTIILEKDDQIISVATVRVHGVTVAEMPLIATCSEHRRQGMCRRLMGAIEEILKSFKVEMLVLSAIPDLIDTWTSGFGFKPVSDDEKRQLSTINLMLFPGTALLKKTLCEAFEMRKPEDGRLSSSKEDLDNVVDFCNTRPEPMTLHQPGWNSLTTGIDLAVGTPQVCTNLEVYEQENCQQQNLSLISSSKALTTVADSESDDVTNPVCCSKDLNILGSDLSTDPRSSAVYKEVRDVEGAGSESICITTEHCVTDGFQNEEFVTHLPRSSAVYKEFRDMEGAGSESICITTEHCVTDGFQNEEFVTRLSESDEIDVKITENSKGKNNCNILNKIDPLNVSNVSVAGIDDTSASIDIATGCEGLQSSTTIGCVPPVEVDNATDLGVGSTSGKADANSLTLACINEVSYPSKSNMESTKEVLNPVIVPVSVTKCSRMPCTFSEGNCQKKNTHGICLGVMGENMGKREPHYTCCDGIYENAQDRDILKMKVGVLSQRGVIVNNVKTLNLSEKTISSCSEMALEEEEKSPRVSSICLQEEYIEDQKQREGICDLV